LPAMLSSMPVSPNSGNHSEIMVCRRWILPMPPVLPVHQPVHFPPVPRETESTSTSPQFRSGTGSSTIVYIGDQMVSLMRNFPRQHSPDRTLSVRIRHLSGSSITSTMCRRAVKRAQSLGYVRIRHLSGGRITSPMCRSALSSAVKTPAGLGILCPNPSTPI
jgi:hypothetical protein